MKKLHTNELSRMKLFRVRRRERQRERVWVLIKLKKINKITEASFWNEYEGSEITFSFSYLRRVIS